MENINGRDLLDYDLIGIGAPAIGYREPLIVTEFMKNLPRLKGRYAFTFCTHGTCPCGFVAEMVTALRKKGLKVQAGMIVWQRFHALYRRPYYTDGHPDSMDIEEAKEFGRKYWEER